MDTAAIKRGQALGLKKEVSSKTVVSQCCAADVRPSVAHRSHVGALTAAYTLPRPRPAPAHSRPGPRQDQFFRGLRYTRCRGCFHVSTPSPVFACSSYSNMIISSPSHTNPFHSPSCPCGWLAAVSSSSSRAWVSAWLSVQGGHRAAQRGAPGDGQVRRKIRRSVHHAERFRGRRSDRRELVLTTGVVL